MLAGRIAQFIEQPDDSLFEPLALEIASAHSTEVGELGASSTLPAVTASEPVVGSELARLARAAAFRIAIKIPVAEFPVLDLTEDDEALTAGLGSEDSLRALAPRGVEVAKARSWLAARQRNRQPCLVLGEGKRGLSQLLEALERRELKFRLPVGSAVAEFINLDSTEDDSSDRLSQLARILALPPERFFLGFRPAGATTPFLAPADSNKFVAPPWTRVRILDPETLEELPPGETGLISIFDLAALETTPHLLTESWGIADGAGFRVVAPGRS